MQNYLRDSDSSSGDVCLMIVTDLAMTTVETIVRGHTKEQ